MATVYASTDTKLRRPVAVKLFHPGGDENTFARLETEAQLLGGLCHPGLLRVFDVCVGADESYLVLQLITGSTLRRVLNEGRLRPAVVARLGARIAETLRYVHSRQIVHRDIKPSNVLVDEAGVGYLADFGIATLIGSARLTRTGHCVGTAAYLAPEQVCDAQPGPAADIYSLGLVLLECLTGRPEYGGTDVEAAVARLHRPPRVPDSIPPGLRDALVAMTARAPAQRPDAARCVELFEDYLARPNRAPEPPTLVAVRPVSEQTTKVTPVPEPDARRWNPVQAVAAGAVLTGIAIAALVASISGGEQPAGPQGSNPVPVVAVVPETAAGQVVQTPAAATQQAPPANQPARQPKKERAKGNSGQNGGHRGGGEG